MAIYAIGDVQGCDAELGSLLESLNFSIDRDQAWFVGDLVNRGPDSLAVLRRIRALGAAATAVLGNHDLHLLAVAFGAQRLRAGDTLAALLEAPDRNVLLDWLIERPLLHEDASLKVTVLHAGLAPQWDMPAARECAHQLQQALRTSPEKLFAELYGDQPDLWNDQLDLKSRLRFTTNCLTRLRYVDAHGRLKLRAKGSPGVVGAAGLTPWYAAADARWRGGTIVFGHWSTLGFFRNDDVIGLDTGCVWGGTLTALRLDVPDCEPVQVKRFAGP